MRVKRKPGDVFALHVDKDVVRHFQYVADDSTQLYSQVIRVFAAKSGDRQLQSLEGLVDREIAFYAHVILDVGIKDKEYQNVGRLNAVGSLDIWFRVSGDHGDPEVSVSRDWYVWRLNSEMKRIGELSARWHHTDLGVIVPTSSLIHRMRHGSYDFVYPGF